MSATRVEKTGRPRKAKHTTSAIYLFEGVQAFQKEISRGKRRTRFQTTSADFVPVLFDGRPFGILTPE
jgi:hypothetical protein